MQPIALSFVENNMKKKIRILEVPLYILIIALACIEKGLIGIACFLILISIFRLIVNTITDSSIYRR